MKKIGLKIGGRQVYADKDGVRFGTRGSAQPVEPIYGNLSKGDARTLRQTLYDMGFTGLAHRNRKPVVEPFAELQKI